MNILIADDEQHARTRLRALLDELGGDYRVVGEAGDGDTAVRLCRERDIDLVLMDIRMPPTSGLEAAATLARMETPPAVVFVTAFDEHAVDAFERGAMDYLVKPVRAERLHQALDRARALTRPQLQALNALDSGADNGTERICTSYRGGVQCVDLDTVIYFQAEQKYVVIRHQGGRLLLEESLKKLEQSYGDRFIRLHRNALVARHRLCGIVKAADGRHMARLRGCDDLLEISRRHLAEIRAFLKGRSE